MKAQLQLRILFILKEKGQKGVLFISFQIESRIKHKVLSFLNMSPWLKYKLIK